MLVIAGYQYRLIHVEDPPEPYGFGLEDPEGQWWLVPPHCGRDARIYYRPHLPVDEEGPVEPWVPIDMPALKAFARWVGSINFGCPHQNWDKPWYIPGHTPDQFRVEVNCREVGCKNPYPMNCDIASTAYEVDWVKKQVRRITEEE